MSYIISCALLIIIFSISGKNKSNAIYLNEVNDVTCK